MFYSVAGRTLLIDAQDDWSTRAVSTLFAGWFLTSVPAADRSRPDATIRIRCGAIPPPIPEKLITFEIARGGKCHTDNQILYLEFDGSVIIIGGETVCTADLWVKEPYDVTSGIVAQLLSHALSATLRRCGLFELHSAAVVGPLDTSATLFAGASGSGKSTLTSLLASCGWDYLSDDIVLLHEGKQGIELQAFRRFFALTTDTIAAAGLVRSSNSETKERITPGEFFPGGQIQQRTAGSLFFPLITNEVRSRVQTLSAADTMARLLRLCPWASYDKPTSRRHLSLLGRLAATTVAFDLFSGTDLLSDPARAAELIHETHARN